MRWDPECLVLNLEFTVRIELVSNCRLYHNSGLGPGLGLLWCERVLNAETLDASLEVWMHVKGLDMLQTAEQWW